MCERSRMQTPDLTEAVRAEVRAEKARRQGITDANLAGPAGLTVRQLRARLRGEVEFGFSELDRLCMALGTPLSEIVRRASHAITAPTADAGNGPDRGAA